MSKDDSVLQPGLSGRVELVVSPDDTARRVGSGRVDVLATPVLIRMMEAAAVRALQGVLPAGAETVGTRLDVRHLAATPVGMRVWACAELVGVEGRLLSFRIEAGDEREPIGEGSHERVIVDAIRFEQRALGKLAATDER